MKVHAYGPHAALIECDTSPSVLAAALRTTQIFIEVVPAEFSVLVRTDALVDLVALQQLIDTIPADLPVPPGRVIEIPTIYSGPDLALVAEATGLTVSEVVSIHSGTTYFAAFSGFAPGYMYCTGLDPRLHLPRRPTPRISVPAGSVAIADVYTSVYPQASPGGWHLLGTTDVQLFDVHAIEPALIRPGDSVRFIVRKP